MLEKSKKLVTKKLLKKINTGAIRENKILRNKMLRMNFTQEGISLQKRLTIQLKIMIVQTNLLDQIQKLLLVMILTSRIQKKLESMNNQLQLK